MAAFKVVILQHDQNKRKDGLYNVKIRVTHNRKVIYIKTSYNISSKQIDKSTGRIINHPNQSHMNVILQSEIIKYEKILMNHEHYLSSLSIKEVMNILYFSEGQGVDFYKYAEHRIADLTGEGKLKTAESYSLAVLKLKKFGCPELAFTDITYNFLVRFENYLKKKDLSITTISMYIRAIRAIFNRAIMDDMVPLNIYPFRKYKIPKWNSSKRNLSIDDIKLIRDAKLDDPELDTARDIFMLTFYLIGINFKDLYNLKEVTKNGRVFYNRFKTGKPYSVRVWPEAQEIINRYKGQEHLLFYADHFQEHKSALKKINKYLRKVGESDHCKFNINLTTYFARHSWATIAVGMGLGKDLVSLALGHSYGSSVTDAYIEYDMRLVDEANRKIMDSINSLADPVPDTDLVTLIGEKRNRIVVLESEADLKVSESRGINSAKMAVLQMVIESHTTATERFLSNIEINKAEIDVLENKRQELISEFDREFAKELIFNEQDFCCPDTDKFESKQAEITEKFNKAKSEIIEGIRTKGKAVKAQIDELTEANRGIQLRIDDNNRLLLKNKAELSELEAISSSPLTKESILSANPEYTKLKEEITKLTTEYNATINPELN